MTISLVTNTSAGSASSAIHAHTNKVKTQTERLATGHRINGASDDAAALGVATNLRAHSTSARQAMRNANDGMSIVNTADGATNEVVNLLTRVRELAIEAASDTLASSERAYTQTEAAEALEEIARIAEEGEFNGIKLTDGSVTSLQVQVGVDNAASSLIQIDLIDLTTTSLGLLTVDLSDATSARSSLDVLDAAIRQVGQARSTLGAELNRLESAYETTQHYATATTGAESVIRDADFAVETADLTTAQILQQAAISVLSQVKGMNASAVKLIGGE